MRTQLAPGDEGEDVRALQARLGALRFWNGEPDGRYGGLTEQAVMAFQKVHAMTVDGVASPDVLAKLANPLPLLASQPDPDHVEVDKTRQLLWVVRGGQVQFVLNASTGSGETFYSPGRSSASVAVTPNGSYQVFREVDGPDTGPLGTLYRPKYFNSGIAVHGYSSVPAQAASHGCVRVSNPAMDMLWAFDLLPSGALVIVTGEGPWSAR